MKKLRLYRHSLKSPDNHISPEGKRLALAVADDTLHSPWANVQFMFHGNLIRTQETLWAMFNGLSNPFEIAHLLGSDEMFSAMSAPKDADGKGWKELATILGNRRAVKALHTPAMHGFFLALARQAVKVMFEQFPDSYCAVGVFHSPTVELAAEAFGYECPDQFPEMSYVEFR